MRTFATHAGAPILAALAAALIAAAPAAAQAWAGTYTDPSGVTIAWRPVTGNNDNGVIVRTTNPTAQAVHVRFRSADVAVSRVPTFGGTPSTTDWDEGIIPPGSHRDNWYIARMVMPSQVLSATVVEPASPDAFRDAFFAVAKARKPGEPRRPDETGHTLDQYDAAYGEALDAWLRGGPLSASAAAEAGRQAYLQSTHEWIAEKRDPSKTTLTPEGVAYVAETERAMQYVETLPLATPGRARADRPLIQAPSGPPAQETVVRADVPREITFEPKAEREAREAAERAQARADALARLREAEAEAAALPKELATSVPQALAQVVETSLTEGDPQAQPSKWAQLAGRWEETRGARRTAGAWLEETGVKAASAFVFRDINQSALREGAREMIADLLRTGAVDVDRGAVLRDLLTAAGQGVGLNWLYDQKISLTTARTGDQVMDQLERTFAAARPENVAFGLYSYLTKVSNEGLKGLAAALGLYEEEMR